MRSKACWWAVNVITVLVLGIASGALAQNPPPPEHLSGLISDYTPETGVSGPWEIRGAWSLDLKGHSGTANFSAILNMTHSDYWIVLNPSAVDDNSATTGRHPHTHHITLDDAVVTRISDNEFTVTGPVNVTGDGSPAPFMKNCTSSTPCTLTLDIVGGTTVEFSNITLTFGGPPTGHFGKQAIHGVVRFVRHSEEDDLDRH